jgi:hypothetical protein
MHKMHLPVTIGRSINLVLAVIAITGCATPYEDTIRLHREPPVCRNSLAEIEYQPIRVGQSSNYQIGEGSPLFEFSGGRSFFAAFALPPYSKPYNFIVSSYELDDGSGIDELYMFRPVLITLDENFKVIRKLEANDFHKEQAPPLEAMKAKGATADRVIGRFGFNEENRHERYLIVFTEQNILDGRTIFLIHHPYPFSSWEVRNAPTGRVRISLPTTPDLFGEAKQRLVRKYETAVPEQSYEGVGFNVVPPSAGGYRFVDLSKKY